MSGGQIPRLSRVQDLVSWANALVTAIELRLEALERFVFGPSGVTAGSYTNANITVNVQGRVTAAANGSGVSVVSKSRPNITVTGTTSPTSIYSTSIAGGTLGTGNMIRVTLLGKRVKNGGGNDAGTSLAIKYGATTLMTLPVTAVQVDSAIEQIVLVQVWLYATGATNTQAAEGTITVGINPSGSGGIVGYQGMYGTAAEDSTASKTLDFIWTPAQTGHSVTSLYALVESF